MKPILFNTEMVRALLEGRKTVTRRVIKFPVGMTGRLPPSGTRDYLYYPGGIMRPPYECGDILYVRETWCNVNKPGYEPEYYYFADTKYVEDYCPSEWKWRPSIHMPKEAARIFLKVTAVWAERLQDITREEAVREGANPACAVLNYKAIWDSTIRPAERDKYGWNANPWVWVIEFERVDRPEEWKEVSE